MDATFGIKNFQNEIAWHYSGWNAKLKSSFNSRHDILLYYSKNMPNFNSYSLPWISEEEYVKVRKQKIHVDKKWWPYILRINGTARAIMTIQENHDFDEALRIVKSTRESIRNLKPVEAEEFTSELERSDKALDELENSIRLHKPLSEKEKLEEELELAINEERFEDAARLRDQLKSFIENNRSFTG
jgi:hypothetical protein